MKILSFLFVLIFSTYTHAQASSISGKYESVVDAKNAHFKYVIELNPNGTFIFTYYADHYQSTEPSYFKYGKGRWKLDKKSSFIHCP
ncbi:MAG: hypothetical protein AAF688_02860 [Bacteroidota bacterium]